MSSDFTARSQNFELRVEISRRFCFFEFLVWSDSTNVVNSQVTRMFFLLGGPVKEPETIKWHHNWNFMLSDNLMCTFPIGVHHNRCCREVHYLVNFVVSADTALYCVSSVHPSGVTPSSGPFHPTYMNSWHATQPAYSTCGSRDVVGKLS